MFLPNTPLNVIFVGVGLGLGVLLSLVCYLCFWWYLPKHTPYVLCHSALCMYNRQWPSNDNIRVVSIVSRRRKPYEKVEKEAAVAPVQEVILEDSKYKLPTSAEVAEKLEKAAAK